MNQYNKESAEKLFINSAILVGARDVIPVDRAEAILGSGAVEFTKRVCPDGFNGYGIGSDTLNYLTKQGFFIAVTYYNVANHKWT